MFKEIKGILTRSHATIWQDVVGGTALMVGLVAVLYLPVVF